MKLSTLREFQILMEMGAKKACHVCGHGMANYHFYRNGGWYCKTTSLANPAPGADVAACQQALKDGKAPRVSGNATPTPTSQPAPTQAAAPAPTPISAPQPTPTAPSVQAASQPASPAPQAKTAPADLRGKMEQWLTDHNVSNYTINPDDSISIDGDLDLTGLRFKRLPVKFRKVTGDVIIAGSLLESLVGLPNEIGGDLLLSDATLSSWAGMPSIMDHLTVSDVSAPNWPAGTVKKVNGVNLNRVVGLTSLVGLPDTINGNLIVNNCKIEQVSDGPTHVTGNVHIDYTSTSASTAKSKIDLTKLPVGEEGDFRIMLNGQQQGTIPSSLESVKHSIFLYGDFTGPVALPDVVHGDLTIRSPSDSSAVNNKPTVTNWPTSVEGNLTIPLGVWEATSKLYKTLKRVNGTITIQGASSYESTMVAGKSKGVVTIHAENLLGLAMIKGVTEIELGYMMSTNPDSKLLLDTLNRVVAGDIDIHEAQDILIDAGYSKQARL